MARVYQGAELHEEAHWLREAANRLRRLSATAPLSLLEQAAIAGALQADPLQAAAAAPNLVQRLDAISLPAERGWKVSAADVGGLTLGRMVRGVAERHVLDVATLRSAEALGWPSAPKPSGARFAEPALLKLGASETPGLRPRHRLRAHPAAGAAAALPSSASRGWAR